MSEIPIFLAANEKYSKYCAVTISSVMKHTKSKVKFYILDGGITEKTKLRICNYVRTLKDTDVEILSLNGFELNKFPNKGHYTVNTYSRYFIPMLKPDFNKVIYIDCDLVVVKDIKEFFDIDMENLPLVATSEDFYPHNKKMLQNFYPQYKDESNYFNAGVVLMDIKSFIKNDYSKQLIDNVFKYYDKVNCPSQDIMNIVFENKCKIVDYKFDYMPDLFYMLKKFKPTISDNYIKDSIIIHYTSGKPWYFDSCESWYFWKYAISTPFMLDFIFDLIREYCVRMVKGICKCFRLVQIFYCCIS